MNYNKIILYHYHFVIETQYMIPEFNPFIL